MGMHDAKHMKHKISYDLFSSSASKASDSYDDDDDDVDEDTRDAHGHGRKKHDESVDFEALAESQSFVPKESSKHKKNPWDDSVERAPKKKSSHRSSSADFDEDEDNFAGVPNETTEISEHLLAGKLVNAQGEKTQLLQQLEVQKTMTQTALEELLLAREDLARAQSKLLSASSEPAAYDVNNGNQNGFSR